MNIYKCIHFERDVSYILDYPFLIETIYASRDEKYPIPYFSAFLFQASKAFLSNISFVMASNNISLFTPIFIPGQTKFVFDCFAEGYKGFIVFSGNEIR